MESKKYPILFHIHDLPYDAFGLYSVPSPVGGVIVLTPNGLIHVDQTSSPGYSVAVNGFWDRARKAGAEKKNPLYGPRMTDCKELALNLERALPVLINPDTLLLISKSGRLILVELEGRSGAGVGWKRIRGGVKGFRVGVGNIGLGGAKTCACVLRATNSGDPRYLFFGSRVGNGLLIQISETTESIRWSNSHVGNETNHPADLDESFPEDIKEDPFETNETFNSHGQILSQTAGDQVKLKKEVDEFDNDEGTLKYGSLKIFFNIK